jgi:hypothetical protein
MFSRRYLLYGLAGLVLCALCALDASAGKGKGNGNGNGGGDEPTPEGTIYYRSGGLTWSMDTDGGNKTALPSNVRGAPSHALHGGNRWFLRQRSTTEGRQLFAVREDGDEDYTVQLTNNAAIQKAGPAHWSKNDDEVSWVAERSVAGSVVEAGIFVAEILFDGAGNVTGLAAQPTSPAIDLPTPINGIDDGEHEWAPDGNRIVYAYRAQYADIFIANLSAGTSTYLARGLQPAWSPDGNTIAYQAYDGMHTVAPDGTGDTRIISRTKGKNARFVASPVWSPSSSHLAYYRAPTDIQVTDPGNVWRALASGANRTNLTAELDVDVDIIAWR